MKKNTEVEVVEVESESTALAVAEAEICRHLEAGKCGNLKGPHGLDCLGLGRCRFGQPKNAAEMPTTLQVRKHRHLVNVPVEQALTQQYERVNRASNAALREMVIFGCMINRIDAAMSVNRYNPDGKGISLRTWLEEKCPSISYSTAMDYRRATNNFIEYMKLEKDTPLLEMMTKPDPYADEAKEQMRRQILETISGLTKTELRRLQDKRGRAGGALKGTVGVASGRRALTVEEVAAEAAAEMRELIGRLYAYVFESKKVALLTEDEQNEFIGALKRITKEAEEQAG